MLDRFVHRNAAGEAVCMASIVPAGTHRAAADALRPEADAPDMFLMSESLLSGTLADRIPRELFRILAVLGVCVLGLLALIFRRAGGVVLCCGVMALNLLCLLGGMAWFGLSWNFFNLTALLLALGTGIDYSIHVLLALRRGLSAGELRRTTGRALMSCCLTTTAGFASLVSARLDGLVSMGLVCAMALAINLIIALFLLPPVAARFLAPPARP
jgi:predicted RND superfamily exporter protein